MSGAIPPRMTRTIEERISSDEIEFISFKCGACKAEHILHLKDDLQKAHAKQLVSCGICHQRLSANLITSIATFVHWKVQAGEENGAISICLRQPEAK